MIYRSRFRLPSFHHALLIVSLFVLNSIPCSFAVGIGISSSIDPPENYLYRLNIGALDDIHYIGPVKTIIWNSDDYKAWITIKVDPSGKNVDITYREYPNFFRTYQLTKDAIVVHDKSSEKNENGTRYYIFNSKGCIILQKLDYPDRHGSVNTTCDNQGRLLTEIYKREGSLYVYKYNWKKGQRQAVVTSDYAETLRVLTYNDRGDLISSVFTADPVKHTITNTLDYDTYGNWIKKTSIDDLWEDGVSTQLITTVYTRKITYYH